ncbi:BAG family molecular chaperone regulator 7 [Zea mays]|uniref:BAG family molecular chaperone regulator 7 n=1 Tax=Zea mays TaxID=4577 RepID=A0A1D6GY27_MAIZE|nr:BAG family molecular chaperone regulator 7 [Zea mays]
MTMPTTTGRRRNPLASRRKSRGKTSSSRRSRAMWRSSRSRTTLPDASPSERSDEIFIVWPGFAQMLCTEQKVSSSVTSVGF